MDEEKSPNLGEKGEKFQPSCECGPQCCGWSSAQSREEGEAEESVHWIKGRSSAGLFSCRRTAIVMGEEAETGFHVR